MLRRAALALRAFLRPTQFDRAADAVPAGPAGPAAPQAPAVVELEAWREKLDLVLSRQIEFHREVRLLLGQAALPPASAWRGLPNAAPGFVDTLVFPNSCLCRQDSFETPYFSYWTEKLGYELHYHRKIWEFVYICQALSERGLLKAGAKGLGFGVGEETLPAYFASLGCRITGTDMTSEAAVTAGWTESNEHAAGKETLRRPAICDDPTFDANVEFRTCDMNAIPEDMAGYDFCWSACALEHLGSIEHGLAFIERSIDCLRPGGFAIHTTEYNLSSNADTVSEGGTVLFRLRDLETLHHRLRAKGHTMAPLNLDPGDGEIDRYIDVPPYRSEPHLKLALWGYAATSVGIIVQKAW
jgi:2-polyprenyl-3-methyl-5-hydroxy-6-metoxy-1,4-benzoquinol methylase